MTSSDTPKAGLAADRLGKLTLEQVNAQLLHAITSCNMSLTGKMEEIKVDIGLRRQDKQKVREHVTETEHRISSLEDDLFPAPNRVAKAEKQISFWSQKAEDLENRLRRNNLRIAGLSERTEGQNPEDFVEAWLKTTFLETKFSSAVGMTSAHQSATKNSSTRHCTKALAC